MHYLQAKFDGGCCSLAVTNANTSDIWSMGNGYQQWAEMAQQSSNWFSKYISLSRIPSHIIHLIMFLRRSYNIIDPVNETNFKWKTLSGRKQFHI